MLLRSDNRLAADRMESVGSMILLLGILYVFIIGAVIVSMTVLCLMGKKEKYNKIYLGFQGMVMLWCLSQIMILFAETQGELTVSYLLGNAGICFVGACWLDFALLYGKRRVPVWVYILPFMLSGMHYLLILTNHFHHLYYTVFAKDEITHGFFFYTNVAETYLFAAAGAALLYRAIEREKISDKSMQTGAEADTAKRLIIAAVLVPIVLNVCYVTGMIRSSFDITPLGFGISGILILLATIRYRFLEINMEAFDTVLSGLSDGVAIFDPTGRCTFYNAAFDQYMDKDGLFQLERIRSQIMAMTRIEDTVYLDSQKRYIQIQIYQDMAEVSLENITADQPLVFVLKDISRYYELLRQSRELAVTSERLALERERNRIAQEVHDTAGHTLTMIQSYMKLASIAGKKQETEQVQEYLEEARELSSQGIRELRESINQLRREADSALVTQGILQLADQVREIPVEVTIQGEDSEEYSHLSHVLYGCVRESITNTLKYADASKMEIVLRFQDSGVELMIADDGVGCVSITDHNGLSGIRERVSEVGGMVKFTTGQDEGFLTLIRIPM